VRFSFHHSAIRSQLVCRHGFIKVEISGAKEGYITVLCLYSRKNFQKLLHVSVGPLDGKLRYLLSRVFLPYATLKFYYPVLQKHPWLMPVCQVRRWGRIIFCGGLRRSVGEIRTIGQTPKEETADTGRLLRDLGL
jgi:hypothetical protein